MLHFFLNCFLFLISIGMLITIHEFGHFWIARKFGVHVEKFSIGIGKVIWNFFDKKGTEYAISIFPLGGYVKMLDVNSNFTPNKKFQTFSEQSFWKKFIIILSGPLHNFLFSIILFWGIFMLGMPSYKIIIQDVIPNSEADQLGISANMEIKKINDIKVLDWNNIYENFKKDTILIKLIHPNNFITIEKKIKLKNIKLNLNYDDPIINFGIIPLIPNVSTRIESIALNSPAMQSDFQKDDKIIKINNVEIKDSWYLLSYILRKNPNKTLIIDIERNNKIIQKKVLSGTKIVNNVQEGFLGITPKMQPIIEKHKTLIYYNPITALYMSCKKVVHVICMILKMLVKLCIGQLSLNNLSGPISIAKGMSDSIHHGIVYYIIFLSLISINLGVINLIPVPVLDGGHILFLIIEKCLRSPIPKKVQIISYQIGFTIIIVLMTVAILNDFFKLK
ncbi:inner membrane zinc RIP metalloprotease [Wigglesworthia glossinidia endosymbiont of Glossina morsitans morsitans (Yale colony)]|uniref:Zinc metalloprotease n=1 Tax=Wigglesworthia glossinidia endosymbiont of Glossina morsitans morsitans (Yale colony) TaxID=1142511 RepID=H6Q4S9_WIGGL|nr:RIP metalloprotease RseP [Wigglesworthia glossinidia]AFA41212.1 inner membrane zinc RIP metalloprotease [Wigglesworthia glossinidia endosymbiont of Glossina morsitans morsitans (Yale colony)]